MFQLAVEESARRTFELATVGEGGGPRLDSMNVGPPLLVVNTDSSFSKLILIILPTPRHQPTARAHPVTGNSRRPQRWRFRSAEAAAPIRRSIRWRFCAGLSHHDKMRGRFSGALKSKAFIQPARRIDSQDTEPYRQP